MPRPVEAGVVHQLLPWPYPSYPMSSASSLIQVLFFTLCVIYSTQSLRGGCTGPIFLLYTPSLVETEWLDVVKTTTRMNKEVYCNYTAPFKEKVWVWLNAIEGAMNHSQLRYQHASYNNMGTQLHANVFSRFTYGASCSDGDRILGEVIIEPLFGALRHPLALCSGDNLLSRDYLLVQSAFSLPYRRHGRNYFFDLGASKYNDGAGGASQAWIINAYRKRGVEFDRIFLWEAQVHSPLEIYKDVPKELFAKYQYFNIPASSSSSDPANPLNILLQLASPSDFVAFKLDIDNALVESEFIQQILSDHRISVRIDELFFEDHVSFQPMVECCWGGSADNTRGLLDSISLFSKLRELGIRAHGWP